MKFARHQTHWQLVLRLLSVLSLLFVMACNEVAPRNRPTFNPFGSTNEEPEPEPEPEEPTRPDAALFFKGDFCACNNTKSVILSNCTSFCAAKNTNGTDILYYNFNVSEQVSLTELKDAAGWCRVAVGESNQPACVLDYRSETGETGSLTLDPPASGNAFTTNISSLTADKTYILTLRETSSGAKSDSIQVRKVSPNSSGTILGPLQVTPVTQYTCIYRGDPPIDDVTGDIFYETAVRLHYYFTTKVTPDPVPEGTPLICHDILTYGTKDEVQFPRLEEVPGAITVWSAADPRFYDNDGDNAVDINKILVDKVKELTGQTLTLGNDGLFRQFSCKLSFSTEGSTGNSTSATPTNMGWFLRYWTDTSTYTSYCPNSTHYNSGDPLFTAMKDIVGVNTEALYIAKKEAETFVNGEGVTETAPSDLIWVTEGDVKKVWFYYKNGVPTQPANAQVIRDNTMRFFYPYDTVNPFVKKSYQRTYTIVPIWSLNNEGCIGQGGSAPTSTPPHDLRVGCIPVGD